MQFIPLPVNTHMHYDLTYTKRSLHSETHSLEPGLCFGFTLVWLQKMQLGHPWGSMASLMDAMLAHHRYLLLRATQLPDVYGNKQVSVARTPTPGELIREPIVAHRCRQQGFQPIFVGELSSFKIVQRLQGYRTGANNTYLLCTSNHAMGVVLRGEELAFFDSNSGVTVYSVEEALDDAELFYLLNRYVVFPFGVMQLAY